MFVRFCVIYKHLDGDLGPVLEYLVNQATLLLKSEQIVESAPTPGNSHLRVQTTLPMNHEKDITRAAFDIGDYFLN